MGRLQPVGGVKLVKIALKVVLFGLVVALRAAIAFVPKVRDHARLRNEVIQIRTKNNSVGRWFEFRDGKLRSRGGIHPEPDGTLLFKNPEAALQLLLPTASHFDFIEAIKSFRLDFVGADEVKSWFTDLVSALMTCLWTFGVDEGNGERRYINQTNGGPVAVSVKGDGAIPRRPPALEMGKVERCQGRATTINRLDHSRFTDKFALA